MHAYEVFYLPSDLFAWIEVQSVITGQSGANWDGPYRSRQGNKMLFKGVFKLDERKIDYEGKGTFQYHPGIENKMYWQ
jgi:hypothetical protein